MSVFLEILDDRILYKGEYFFVVYDGYPVSDGHCLIVSNEVKETYFDLSSDEKKTLMGMIDEAKVIIEADRKLLRDKWGFLAPIIALFKH